jgi:cytochrome c oxidase assembly protein subunit 15
VDQGIIRYSAERRAAAAWLFACAALVFAMVVVGGITRLTRSGLSIVEWQPLVGALPPLSQADWDTLFAKYRTTPEFRLVNFDMTLDGFKRIFWWEYAHRLLGRLIGAVFLLPFVWFMVRRRLERTLTWKLAGVFALGALQGALGWYMVKSGLVDDPRVSHFRLTAHLGVALAIFAALLWIALDLLPGENRIPGGPSLARAAAGVAAVVFVMALSGGMVAGLRAGSAYNTFPLMNGHFIPPEILMLEPWWKNLLYNMATVQFVHRSIGWLLIVLVPLFLVPRARSAACVTAAPCVPSFARDAGTAGDARSCNAAAGSAGRTRRCASGGRSAATRDVAMGGRMNCAGGGLRMRRGRRWLPSEIRGLSHKWSRI